jgi:hypothetical protein
VAKAGLVVRTHLRCHLNRCLSTGVVESHLTTQRAAVKMLHDRIAVLVHYVKNVMAGGKYLDLAAARMF